MFARVTFLPSLGWNLLRNRLGHWNWFDRIDSSVVLGALPFRGPITHKILLEENVHSVISMNEDFELRAFVTTPNEWRRLGVDFLQLPTQDILHSPSLDRLQEGVQFLLSRIECPACLPVSMAYQQAGGRQLPWTLAHHGKALGQSQPISFGRPLSPSRPSIYVHCKAGRTRSATLVACYLIQRYSLTPEQAVAELTARRPQVLLHTKQWAALEQFHQQCKKFNFEQDNNLVPDSLLHKHTSPSL